MLIRMNAKCQPDMSRSQHNIFESTRNPTDDALLTTARLLLLSPRARQPSSCGERDACGAWRCCWWQRQWR